MSDNPGAEGIGLGAGSPEAVDTDLAAGIDPGAEAAAGDTVAFEDTAAAGIAAAGIVAVVVGSDLGPDRELL